MMTLSRDETRALGFIGLLISLSLAARLVDRPEPIEAGGGLDIAQLEAASRDRLGRPEGPEPLRPGQKLDPNTATAAELARLPRAASLAARIVADRESNGAFRSVQDLDRVPGIGPVTLERWKDLLTLPWQAPAAAAAPAPPPTRPAPAGRATVDPNRASAAELERLPGIGPALAERIVAWREANGPFRTLEDLVRVYGIGPATLARIRPYLKLGA